MMHNALDKEYWRKFYAREFPESHYEKLREINKQWVLKTPFGPMVHKETGKGYWETQVDMEHKYETSV